MRIKREKAFYGPFANLVVFLLLDFETSAAIQERVLQACVSHSLEKLFYCYRNLLPAVLLKPPYTVILYELYASSRCSKLLVMYTCKLSSEYERRNQIRRQVRDLLGNSSPHINRCSMHKGWWGTPVPGSGT